MSRRDRGAGLTLEKNFLEKNKLLTQYSTYEEIDRYLEDVSIYVFDAYGYLKVFTPQVICEKSYCIYDGEEDTYMIKNLRGFCRVN